ncbi:MAG: hypothetical protein VYB54_15720 [Pseudomonadota bacterium]|nr:hypothetical protein [Pseudomonadota bacterium]
MRPAVIILSLLVAACARETPKRLTADLAHFAPAAARSDCDQDRGECYAAYAGIALGFLAGNTYGPSYVGRVCINPSTDVQAIGARIRDYVLDPRLNDGRRPLGELIGPALERAYPCR